MRTLIQKLFHSNSLFLAYCRFRGEKKKEEINGKKEKKENQIREKFSSAGDQ